MNLSDTVLHVINHTHWDREWFVPFTFTRRWIPRLINNLDKVVAANPEYKFLFDAQTMVIEDLEVVDADAYIVAHRLIRSGNLEIGPYYAQVDMRMSGPESLVRNLRIGTSKAKDLGGSSEFTAWGVDIFGHVSQSPQIHSIFDINNVYLWRGPDRLEPFFWWRGADGTTMLAVDLFAGGYRNFYRVTTKDRLALPRLEHEVQKLRPYYRSGNIPVFDGFDLDSEPGDAASYFAARHEKDLKNMGVRAASSSPFKFAQNVRDTETKLPTLSGELISGKYSSVFPGTLSARVYSKLAIGHAERLLYRYAEPLSSLLPPGKYPQKLFEEQSKLILQNLVHDVISGCSIDQVHEIAELRTQKLDVTLRAKTAAAVKALAGSLGNGVYAYLPAGGKTQTQIAHGGKLYKIAGNGVSVTKVIATTKLPTAVRAATKFAWSNRHFKATLGADGSLNFGRAGQFGQLVLRQEAGDTYWDEPRGDVTPLSVDGPLRVLNETEGFSQVTFTATAKPAGCTVKAFVTLTFDDSPLVKWQVKLSTSGAGFSVLMRHSYNASPSKLNVGMQFDNVERAFWDTNLLGRKLDPTLTSVLNNSSQRDVDQTFTFPLHSYISPVLKDNKIHLLAKSLRAYQTDQPGHIDLVLSRTVDWLMKPSHHLYHTGDAGPKFYVPDARSERETNIECALLVSEAGPDDIDFHQTVDQYICTPLLFKVSQSSGALSQLKLFDDQAILSSLHLYKGKRLARIYNPTSKQLPLSRKHPALAGDAISGDPIDSLAPKAIATIALDQAKNSQTKSAPRVEVINWPEYPIGPDSSKPDPAMIVQLESMYQGLQQELDSLATSLKAQGSSAPHSLQHRYYVVARECMEAQLSLLWNKRRAERPAKLTDAYVTAVDEKLYSLATKYNNLRIMRRMYDYIIGIDAKDQTMARPASHDHQKT